MAFWDRWFKRKESRIEGAEPDIGDRELIKQWGQSINDSLTLIREELRKMPSETVSRLSESYENKSRDVLSKLDGLPDKITAPLGDMISVSKQEILTELVRISSSNGSHHSHDSGGAQGQTQKSIQDITMGLTGKQKKLLAILLDSGFLSYAEIGGKLGITHESAKNLVNRLLKDTDKGRLFCKQETDQGIKVGVSSDVQDEVLKKKYRTTPNDSD